MTAAVRALLFKEIREGRWKFAIAAMVLVAVGVSVPLSYELFGGVLGELLKETRLPQFLKELLPPDLLQMDTYLWSNWHAKNLYQAVVIVAIIFGSTAVAGEFSRGSAQYLFSRPVARRSVVLTKTGVDLLWLASAALLGTIALDITSRLAHGYAVPWTFYAGLVPILAGGTFVYGLALVVSTRIDDPVKAGVSAAAIAALFSIPSYVPAWRSVSVYVQMTGRALFRDGAFPWLPVLVMVALAAGLVAAAAERLEKRDIA